MFIGKDYKDGKIAYEKIPYESAPLLVLYPARMEDDVQKYFSSGSTDALMDNHWHRSLEIIYTNQSDGYLHINGTEKYLPQGKERLTPLFLYAFC